MRLSIKDYGSKIINIYPIYNELYKHSYKPLFMKLRTEHMRLFTLCNRVKYSMKFGWFYRINVFGFSIPWVPSDWDIHIHEAWFEVKK